MKKFLLYICIVSIQFANGQDVTGKILFSRHSYNNSATPDSIFAMNNDGKTLTFITLGNLPRLSRDGKWMAFSNSPIPNESYEASLWLRDLVRQKDTLIVQSGGVGHYLDYYDFSPTDTKIVYSYDCGIYTVNPEGSNVNQILNRNCYTDYPTVSPSDSTIVYHDVPEGLSTMSFSGANDSRLPHTYPGDLYPVWSPDGQWIAYEKSNPNLQVSILANNVYKIKPDGSDSTPLTFFPPTDTIGPDVVWAWDMQTLFFIGKISDTTGIYQVHTDGSGSYKRIFDFHDTSTFAYVGTQGYFLYHFWLGLADSIFTNKVVTNYCDSLNISFGDTIISITNDTVPATFLFNAGATFPAQPAHMLRYKWKFTNNSTMISDSSNQKSPIYVFTSPGNYSVCLNVTVMTSSDTCTTTKCANITIEAPLGVLNINGMSAFKLSPNPSDGNIQITMPEGMSGTNQFSITNILGEKVYEGTIITLNTKLTLNIPDGTYFVSIFNNEKQFTERLVIQK